VSTLLLGLTSFLLYTTTHDLLLLAQFSSLESLCFNQFGISDLLIFFLLGLDNGELVLLKHLHSGLFESAFTENVKHRLHLLVEVEEFWITVMDLGGLAVLLGGHARLE